MTRWSFSRGFCKQPVYLPWSREKIKAGLALQEGLQECLLAKQIISKEARIHDAKDLQLQAFIPCIYANYLLKLLLSWILIK